MNPEMQITIQFVPVQYSPGCKNTTSNFSRPFFLFDYHHTTEKAKNRCTHVMLTFCSPYQVSNTYLFHNMAGWPTHRHHPNQFPYHVFLYSSLNNFLNFLKSIFRLLILELYLSNKVLTYVYIVPWCYYVVYVHSYEILCLQK